MFIELTNENTGELIFINLDSVRAITPDNIDKDKSTVRYKNDDGYVSVTESYAEVVTKIKNLTEPKEEYITDVIRNNPMLNIKAFDSDDESYVDPFGSNSDPEIIS